MPTLIYNPKHSGTAAAALAMQTAWPGQHVTIDLTTDPLIEAKIVPATSPLLLVLPVEDGQLPTAIMDMMATHLSGEGSPAILIALHNGNYGHSLTAMADAVTQKGFNVVAAAAFDKPAGESDQVDDATIAQFSKLCQARFAKKDFSRPALPGDPNCTPHPHWFV